MENAAEIAAIGSVGLPGVHGQYDPSPIEGMPYLRALNIGVTKLPKRFWEVQYPLLNLLETPSIVADPEGASISWSCLELRSDELAAEGGRKRR